MSADLKLVVLDEDEIVVPAITPLKLAARVREQYTRFVAFHADFYDAEADLMALWTMHTHAFGAAEATPYIAVMSPTAEAGKSKIIDVATHLVLQPFAVVDPSASSLFRNIDTMRPTVFVDEADQWAKDKNIRAVLNAGYRWGGCVTRSIKVGDDWAPYEFNVFCPKLIAGIAGENLPVTGATLSRCVQLPMQRRTKDEPIERFFHRDARTGHMLEIKNQIVRWAEGALPRLEESRPEYLDGLSDRQI